MAPPQQDAFMDDTDDCCPLCVEEFDLSDRSFRPCPCGYQVCQFCYNNIKTNMNGLCPACRRQYDDKNIQWKVISPEEAKADVAAQARKKAAARQKEAERRQVETQNRKHLSGLRVVQKNLVYVVGMNLVGANNDDILSTLRGPHHFGQYGDIVKIVVSKAKSEGQPLGIYVTFVKKEEAASCIAALDGREHENRTLRAQYGTTKYCSAYLRNEKCNNRSCMFLHETGEDGDSFSRQDLSSINALSTQRKADPSQAGPQQQAPPQHAPQHMAAASQPSSVPSVKADAMSRSDSDEGSALPTTANWAKNPQIEQSRRSSQAASRLTPSPQITHAKIVSRPASRAAQTNQISQEEKGKAKEDDEKKDDAEKAPLVPSQQASVKPREMSRLEAAVQRLSTASFAWSLDRSLYDSDTLAIIDNFPPLIDPNGGALRLAQKLRQERERAKQDEESKAQGIASVDDEENFASGSLQLGGEPDTVEQSSHGRRQPAIQAASAQFDGPSPSIGSDFAALSLGGRSLTPQQQRNISLFKSTNPAGDSFSTQIPRSGNTSQHQPQLSNPFQTQNQQFNAMSRHGRQTSRYNFVNDNPIVSGVKPGTNTHLLAQQQGMIPPGHQKAFTSQSNAQPSLYSNNFSNVQGPPPGLKSSGTPPISGGGMFGQGHGFASAMGGSLNYGGGNLGIKNTTGNDDHIRDIIRGRGGIGSSDNAKHPFLDDLSPFFIPGSKDVPKLQQNLVGDQASSSHAETPAMPPGLPLPGDFPPLSASSKTPSRQDSMIRDESSAYESKRTQKPLVPAIPQVSEQNLIFEKEDLSGNYQSLASTNSEVHEMIGSKEVDTTSSDIRDIDTAVNADIKGKVVKNNAKEQENGKVQGDMSAEREKRRAPEVLDIDAAKKAVRKQNDLVTSPWESSKSDTLRKPIAMDAAPIVSQPQTPITATSQTSPSPAIRQARTLRLLPASKTETQASTSQPASAGAAPPVKSASRKGSIASFNLPETPLNDTTPDNISSTSASASRAASPQPSGKAGTTAVRQKTKSQAKKERQARVKAEETKFSEKPSPHVEDEPVQAPIIGRKKKTKKQPSQKPAPVPPSPEQINKSTARKIVDTNLGAHRNDEAGERFSVPQTVDEEVDSNRGFESNHILSAQEGLMGSLAKAITPASILASMKINEEITVNDIDPIINIPTYNSRSDPSNYGIAEHEPLPALSEEEMQMLEDGEPVMLQVSQQECAIILPDHSVLRYLSRAEAEKYIRLRKSTASGDFDFFTSSRLPSCMSMKDSWDDYSAYGSTINNQDLMYNRETEELSVCYGSSVLRLNDNVSFDDSWQRGDLGNEDLASTIETMSLEEAEAALKRSEEQVVGKARKDADAVEKRLNQTVKKNRKILREITGS